MNRQIFMPPLDSIWRFTAPWTPSLSFLVRSDNSESLYADNFSLFYNRFVKADPNPGQQGPVYDAWNARFDKAHQELKDARWKVVFPIGTVIVFDRYHASHSGYQQITVRVLASPEPMLNPKKQGGKMRGAGRIYLMLEELNSLPEMEHVDDFQAG